MTKVVYNACYGGFGLSPAAVKLYGELKGVKIYPFISTIKNNKFLPMESITWKQAEKEIMIHYCTSKKYTEDGYFSYRDLERDDPILVQVVEKLGDKASGSCAHLMIKNVPAGSQYRIDEYDGNERIMTCEDYNWKTA